MRERNVPTGIGAGIPRLGKILSLKQLQQIQILSHGLTYLQANLTLGPKTLFAENQLSYNLHLKLKV
jgi:hypothetical protein